MSVLVSEHIHTQRPRAALFSNQWRHWFRNLGLIGVFRVAFGAVLLWSDDISMASRDARAVVKDDAVVKPTPPPRVIQHMLLQTMSLQGLRDKHGYLMNSVTQMYFSCAKHVMNFISNQERLGGTLPLRLMNLVPHWSIQWSTMF